MSSWQNQSSGEGGCKAPVQKDKGGILGISLLAFYFENDVLYTVWFGLLLSLTAHFLIHIGQSIYIKKYIPSLITSIICLPISLVILINSSQYIDFSLSSVLLMGGSILLMIANLRFAHWLIHRFGKQLG